MAAVRLNEVVSHVTDTDAPVFRIIGTAFIEAPFSTDGRNRDLPRIFPRIF